MGLSFPLVNTKKSPRVLTVAGKRISISGAGSHIPRPLLDHLIELSICFLNTPGLMSAGAMNYCRDGCSDILHISFKGHMKNRWWLWSFVVGKVSVKMRVSKGSARYSADISYSPVTDATLLEILTDTSKTV